MVYYPIIIQLLQVHSWSVYHVTDQFGGNDADISDKVVGELCHFDMYTHLSLLVAV